MHFCSADSEKIREYLLQMKKFRAVLEAPLDAVVYTIVCRIFGLSSCMWARRSTARTRGKTRDPYIYLLHFTQREGERGRTVSQVDSFLRVCVRLVFCLCAVLCMPFVCSDPVCVDLLRCVGGCGAEPIHRREDHGHVVN